MSRLPTVNYGAVPTTQFQWATTDNDLFDRELDLYNLSQAVELHDHSSAHGLAVSRLTAGAVVAASIGALAVQTAALDNLAVTGAKLAAGTVTQDKIAYPLIEPTNDMTGGVRIRDTSNTYALGYYIAANGLGVLGVGAAPGTAIAGNLVLGQAGQVSIGAVQGAALFNVMSQNGALGSGARVYSNNVAFYADYYLDTNGDGVLSHVTNNCLWMRAGRVGFGSSANMTARINITQAAGIATDGMLWVFGGATGRAYLDASGHFNLQSASTNVILQNGAAALTSLVDNTVSLGTAGLKWAALFAVTATFAGAVSGITTLAIGGALSGVTTLAMSGALSGATTGAFSAGLTCTTVAASTSVATPAVNPLSDSTGSIGTANLRWHQVNVEGAVGIGLGLGTPPSAILHLGADNAVKPSTNTWTVSSDIRVKDPASIHDYTGGLKEILRLQPVHYRTNGLGGTQEMTDKDDHLIGFVADDVVKIAPEMVSKRQSKLRPEDRRNVALLGINTHALPFMQINAIKELTARIEQLEELLKDRKN